MTANPDKCNLGCTDLNLPPGSVGQGLVKVPEARIADFKNYKQPIPREI